MGSSHLSASGLPDMDSAQRDLGEAKGRKMLLFSSVVGPLIGAGIAFLIYNVGSTAEYDKKISMVVAYEMQLAYLSAYVFCRLVSWINMYPMIWKSRVMPAKAGNLRANMYIFKEHGSDKVVVLDEDKETGRYNRANRSLHHFVENMGGYCVGLVLASFCFPYPTFIITLFFAFGRATHQIGYSNGGYGSHGAGFGIATLSVGSLEGLLLVVGLKSFGVM